MTRLDGQFPTTRWTLVLGAATGELRGEALQWLCEHYWQPIYAYVRRRGHDPSQAQDLTQGFLMQFLEKRSIESAHPDRGRFRSYLLGALKNFLADRHDFQQAAVRGGAATFLPLSFPEGEELYLESPQHLSPDALYERHWALSVIERVLHLMHAEHEAMGKARQFQELQSFLTGDEDYRAAATALGMSDGSVRVAVHRLRRRYRDLLVAEISDTVSSGADVEEEIRHLIAALGR